MIAFTRILFPVDLSPQCREAAPFVKAMATRFNSRLFVLNVLEPRLSFYPIPAAATPAALEHERLARAAHHRQFESFISEVFNGISVQPQVSEGDATENITCFAREHNVD